MCSFKCPSAAGGKVLSKRSRAATQYIAEQHGMACAHFHMGAQIILCVHAGNRRSRIAFAEAMHARFARRIRPARGRVGARRKAGEARTAASG